MIEQNKNSNIAGFSKLINLGAEPNTNIIQNKNYIRVEVEGGENEIYFLMKSEDVPKELVEELNRVSLDEDIEFLKWGFMAIYLKSLNDDSLYFAVKLDNRKIIEIYEYVR